MNNLIKKNERIFVAGHNGMVGSSIVRILLSNGYCIESEGGKLLIENRNKLDLCSYNDVMDWFEFNKPTIVIMAAAKVGGIYANYTKPFDFISENLKIQQNIIEASWKNKVKRLLFLGSSCIYPKASKIPIQEDQLLTSSLENTNQAYAIAKISGLKLCEALREQHDFDAITLMPTNLYGPGDNYHIKDSHVMASLIRKFTLAKINKLNKINCWGSGNPLREFLHVDDLALACLKVLERWDPDLPHSPKDINGNKLLYLNVGAEEEISIHNLAHKIAYLLEYKGEIFWDKSKPDGTFSKKLDSSKIRSLGWKPTISLENGIKNTIKEVSKKVINKSGKENLPKNFFCS